MNLPRMQVKCMLYIYIGFKQAVSKKITRQQHGLNALFSEIILIKSIFFRIRSNKNAILFIINLQGAREAVPWLVSHSETVTQNLYQIHKRR